MHPHQGNRHACWGVRSSGCFKGGICCRLWTGVTKPIRLCASRRCESGTFSQCYSYRGSILRRRLQFRRAGMLLKSAMSRWPAASMTRAEIQHGRSKRGRPFRASASRKLPSCAARPVSPTDRFPSIEYLEGCLRTPKTRVAQHSILLACRSRRIICALPKYQTSRSSQENSRSPCSHRPGHPCWSLRAGGLHDGWNPGRP